VITCLAVSPHSNLIQEMHLLNSWLMLMLLTLLMILIMVIVVILASLICLDPDTKIIS
jgi:hypothetical protein